MRFGKKEEADFFILSLRPAEFIKIKTHGHWPFLIEILPNASSDGLFHGLLALKPEKPKTHTKAWRTVDSLDKIRRGIL